MLRSSCGVLYRNRLNRAYARDGHGDDPERTPKAMTRALLFFPYTDFTAVTMDLVTR